MGLHFSKEEFTSRKAKVLKSMKGQNIDAILTPSTPSTAFEIANEPNDPVEPIEPLISALEPKNL